MDALNSDLSKASFFLFRIYFFMLYYLDEAKLSSSQLFCTQFLIENQHTRSITPLELFP